MKHLKIDYSDVMSMPVYERRFFIEMFKDEMEQQKERMDEAKKNRSSGGKGTRSKTVSGEALKSQMRNKQIPNQ
jgi:hypothetical protein